MIGRHAVGQPEGRQRRRTIRFAGDMGKPAHGLGNGAEAGAVAQRPRLAEARHPKHDQARVQFRQHLPAQTPALQRAGPEILDKHIRVPDQRPQRLGAVRLLQVQHDRALVARRHLPPEPDAVLAMPHAAQRVAARVLHLDDVGPEVAQNGCRQRPCENRRAVDHLQAGDRALGLRGWDHVALLHLLLLRLFLRDFARLDSHVRMRLVATMAAGRMRDGIV